ncbi:MAG: heavy-metal-associated domain-containing protein [Anaerolineae bacterium]|nr:heavy-metal-associated domain-containing protein [Anaerolineae bacterium]
MSENLKFKVTGDRRMNCGGCENGVKSTLKQLPGVIEVLADRNTQMIEVSLESGEPGADALISQLSAIGYQVEPV